MRLSSSLSARSSCAPTRRRTPSVRILCSSIMPGKTYVLGLTGSIGMGKSTVGSFFREEGVPVLEADLVVHKLYGQGGAAVPAVGALFPDAMVSGAIDRALLSKSVVGKPEALKRLEEAVHPLVEAERARFVTESSASGESLVVVDIPLLYETGSEKGLDGVVVVSAPADVQRARVLARPGMTEDKFVAILSRQMPDEEKRRRADFVVDTGCAREETRSAVVDLVRALRQRVPASLP